MCLSALEEMILNPLLTSPKKPVRHGGSWKGCCGVCLGSRACKLHRWNRLATKKGSLNPER